MECNSNYDGNHSNKKEDKDMATQYAVRDVAEDLVEIEKVFVQRANEMRNPLSGQELLDESVRLLMELRAEGEIREK